MYIVAFGKQRQVAHEVGVDYPVVDSIGHQVVDLPIARHVGEDHRGARLRRIFLEPQKRRAIIAERHLEEGIEVLTQGWRQVFGDADKDCLLRLRRRRSDQPFQRRRSGQHDLPRT